VLRANRRKLPARAYHASLLLRSQVLRRSLQVRGVGTQKTCEGIMTRLFNDPHQNTARCASTCRLAAVTFGRGAFMSLPTPPIYRSMAPRPSRPVTWPRPLMSAGVSCIEPETTHVCALFGRRGMRGGHVASPCRHHAACGDWLYRPCSSSSVRALADQIGLAGSPAAPRSSIAVRTADCIHYWIRHQLHQASFHTCRA
jgi:hypothetical protein